MPEGQRQLCCVCGGLLVHHERPAIRLTYVDHASDVGVLTEPLDEAAVAQHAVNHCCGRPREVP